MKRYVLACALVLVWATAARSDAVEVYDWSTGTYKDYDVRQRGRNVEVFDWSEGRYRDYSVSKSGREVYDWQNNKYLDLKSRGEDRFEVYDWEDHKYYDVKVKHR